VLSDVAWGWLSPLLIVLGCMGLLWSFRTLLQKPSAADASAPRVRNYWNRLWDVEMLGLDVSVMLQYLLVVVPSLLLMFAVVTIVGILALAGFLKLAELTGLEALMHYIGRSLGR